MFFLSSFTVFISLLILLSTFSFSYDLHSIRKPLGSAILFEEDRWVQDSAMSLMRYWSAEALSQGHVLVMTATKPSSDASSFDNICFDFSSPPSHHIGGLTTSDCDIFVRTFLPRNLTWDKLMSQHTTSSNNNTLHQNSNRAQADTGFTSIIEEETEQQLDLDDFEESTRTTQTIHSDHSNPPTHDESSTDDLLKNAWQYKVSIQMERSGGSTYQPYKNNHLTSTNTDQLQTNPLYHANVPQNKTTSSSIWTIPTKDIYCHSYDLSRNFMDSLPIEIVEKYVHDTIVMDCSQEYSCTTTTALSLFQKWIENIRGALQQHPSTVIRWILPNIPCISSLTASALSLTLSYIRIHSLPVVLLVTIRPWLNQDNTSSLHALRRTCDAVFSLQGLASLVADPPPEFHDLQGIFHIHKISSLFPSTTQFNSSSSSSSSHTRRPLTNRYGIKRDRRRLTLQMLHLPPEEFSTGGSSVTSSSVRTGGGVITNKDTPITSSLFRSKNNSLMGCSSNSSSSSMDF